MRGHVFCSTQCARDAGRLAVWGRAAEALRIEVSSRLALLCVALISASPVVLALRAVGELDRLNEPPRFALPRRGASARIGAIILSPEAPAVAPSPRPASPPVAPPDLSFPDMTIGPRDRREIVVSFDAGSTDRGAVQILDALRERGIRTTIFLTGEFIARAPELARRIAADGHEAGNHTDTHPHLTTYAQNGRQATRPGVDRAFLARELSRTARLYRETTGKAMAPIWRAPYGEQNPEIRRWAAEEGYWHVGWTGGRAGLDALDWVTDPASPAYHSAERVVAMLVERAESGGIVLLHLGSDRDVPVASRIGTLFDGLAARGFRYARATEFLDREGLTVERLAALSGGASASAR